MPEKIIGVLGGLGPEATLDLYRRIIALPPARVDQDHLRVVIDSNTSIPDPNDALMIPGAPDSTPALVATARGLERMGADFIVIPCNTAHCFLDAVQAGVRIPVLSIIAATVEAVCALSPAVQRVGLLASPAVVARGLYAHPLQARGIQTLALDDAGGEALHAVIFAVKAGDKGASNWARFTALADGLVRRGAQALILACTELPLLFEPQPGGEGRSLPVPCIDTLDVLARAAVKEALLTSP